jgi:PAS domain S-box-containing protein
MNTPLRVLIVEDNPPDAELVVHELRRAGFEPEWKCVDTEAGYAASLHPSLDIILSDFEIPQFGGMRAFELLKERGLDVPFFIISGTIGEEHAVDMMKLGVDDYFLKDRLARLGPGVRHALEARKFRAERRRTEQQLHLQATALETAANGVVITDVEGIILWVNPAFVSLTGYAADEAIGKTPRILKSGRHDRKFYQSLWSTIMAGRTWRGNFTNRRKDGSLYQDEHTITPVRSREGVITHFIAIMNDVTERQRAEKELLASERKFRLLAENISDVFWIASPDLKELRYVSPAYEQTWGRSIGDLYTHPHQWLEAILPEDRGPVLETFSRLMGSVPSVSAEYRVVRPDGDVRWVHNRGFQVRDASGKLEHLTGIACDITDRRKAVEQLLWKTAFFEAQVNSSPDGILVVDHENKRILQNQRMADLWKLPPELANDTDDRPQLEWVTGQVKNPRQFAEKVAYLYAHPAEIGRDELELLDGRFFDRYSAPVLGHDEKYYGRIWIFRDVTERRQTEEKLRASEASYRALFEYAPDGIVIVDFNGFYLDVNASICRMLGYTREEFIGMHASDIVAPDEIPEINPALGEIKAGADYHREWRFRRKDGSIVETDVIATKMPDGNLLAVIRDVTERKRAHERIAEQADFLDKARDAILVRDLEGGVLFWNEGAHRMYGWSAEEAVGRNIGEMLYPHPAKFKALNAQTIRDGEWNGELKHLTKDRGEIAVEARWTLVLDDAGQPKSILAINTDVTEKKKIEAQFMRAQRMESIGTLAGGIAHDLNNILAPIMMSIELLKCTTKDAKSREMLGNIEISARRGADIVRQVLSFARGLEGKRIEIQPKHLLKDLESIIKDTFPKDIRLRFSLPGGIWTILGDPTQVHQILLNLCVNARDAMPTGGNLTVAVENAVIDEQYAAMNIQAKPGKYVIINVTDSGTGMSQEVTDKIFEPFFTTKDLNKGTGLGLSTVMAIVKSHEGIINVYSEPGKGTTFKVYLPAIDGPSEEGDNSSAQQDLPRGNGETILVIDDEASILTITTQTLQAFGYKVLSATDGAEAVAIFAQHPGQIAVVLTDMMMPVMDGVATIHALTRIQPTIKIIATSGLNANGSVAKATSMGVKHFLTKPYTAGTLLKTLKAILEEA